LILGRYAAAADWYRKAVALAFRRPVDIAVMRRQARRLLAKASADPTAQVDSQIIEYVLPVPPVVAFSGHMTDALGRAIPRFPEQEVDAVRSQIKARLREKGGTVHAVCSAARGGDLVFLETVVELRGTATVILPFPAADFKGTSVGGQRSANGKTWNERFDAVLASERVVTSKPLLEKVPAESERPAAFDQCNAAIIEEAERLARVFDDATPTLLTVLVPSATGDGGKRGDGGAQGGTAHMVRRWTERGHPHTNIDPSAGK
jgi:hypothetical protein